MSTGGTGTRLRVLILGGTGDAAELAEALAKHPDYEVITSLAGRTRAPRAVPGALRVGGFGGAGGLARYLRMARIGRVIDATHPFAARMQEHAWHACCETGVPRLQLLRAPWIRQPGDRWHEVAGLAEAAALLPALGRRVFLSVGGSDLGAFAHCRGVFFLVRGIERPHDLPLQDARWISGRGPFLLEEEIELLREHRIEVLVTKASGGEATRAKIAAARELGLPVIMQRRPAPPPGPVVAGVGDALAWLEDAGAMVTSEAGAAHGDGPGRRAGCR